jgi:FtsP/CotA-like multicopper oxidase with cupredoxin domain
MNPGGAKPGAARTAERPGMAPTLQRDRRATMSGFRATTLRVAGVLSTCAIVAASLVAGQASAAVPGLKGNGFALTASVGYQTQPDGAYMYSWGYGCTNAAAQSFAPFTPASASAACPLFEIPGPTMIVTEGQQVTVTLTNALPPAAGNTSIVFPGFAVTASGGVQGMAAQEAAPGGTVIYTFVASKPGTYAYYSGTQPDLQIEMGMYGALIVLPATVPATCTSLNAKLGGQTDFRLAASAYDHPQTCYDREYMMQLAEVSARVHQQAQDAIATSTCMAAPCPPLNVAIEPYHPEYFVINGRSMPDNMDPHYSPLYPNQPYNANPHMHPGETVLMRIIGQGRWQHPYHFHGNHARVIARDGNLLLSANDPQATSTNPPRLAGPLLFTTPTVPGQSQDQLFTWTGKGLNWDVYGHKSDDNPAETCAPDANGYYTVNSNPPAPATAPNYGEWCADHNKPIPVTPPDPLIVANGLWYGGTPYLGLANTHLNQGFTSTPLPPGTAIQNLSAGYAYMWHSHNEREITTNNVFPGGMLMMLIIDSPSTAIDETL